MIIKNLEYVKLIILKELEDGPLETKDLAERLADLDVAVENKQLYNLIKRMAENGLVLKDDDQGVLRLEDAGRAAVLEYEAFQRVMSQDAMDDEVDGSEQQVKEEIPVNEQPMPAGDGEVNEKLYALWDEIRSQLFYDGSRIRIKKKDNGVSYRVRGPQKNHCRKSLFNAMRGFWSGERVN